MSDKVSWGEPCFFQSDNGATFSPTVIRRFAQAVLRAEAWFETADGLIAAMDLVEPRVGQFWQDV